MSNEPFDSDSLNIDWPLWAKVYAVIVGAPMIGVSIGIAVWLVLTRFGGLMEDSPWLASLLLTAASLTNFALGAWLFYTSVQRLVARQSEALLLAATGHLLLAIPTLVFIAVSFVVNHQRFINDLTYSVSDGQLSTELKMIIWSLFHVYLALFLALADNTGDWVDSPLLPFASLDEYPLD